MSRAIGRFTSRGAVTISFAACLALCACEDKIERSERGTGAGSPSASASAKSTAAKPIDGLTLKDDDFVESDHNRDPFRSFTLTRGKADAAPELQRSVIMPNTSVEEMKLIAIISGLSRPKAMLTDQHNVGYVVQRGDYIGRPKVIQTSGSVAMTLNWRVDRIRDNEVVLTREDPGEPGRPPLSRIITMHDEIATR